jgi:hypothetical protein
MPNVTVMLLLRQIYLFTTFIVKNCENTLLYIRFLKGAIPFNPVMHHFFNFFLARYCLYLYPTASLSCCCVLVSLFSQELQHCDFPAHSCILAWAHFYLGYLLIMNVHQRIPTPSSHKIPILDLFQLLSMTFLNCQNLPIFLSTI